MMAPLFMIAMVIVGLGMILDGLRASRERPLEVAVGCALVAVGLVELWLEAAPAT